MATRAGLIDGFDVAAENLALALWPPVELDSRDIVRVFAVDVGIPGAGAVTRLNAVTFLADIRLPQIEIGSLEILARLANQRIIHRCVVDPAVGGLIDQPERRAALRQQIEGEVARVDIGSTAATVSAVDEVRAVFSNGGSAFVGGEPRLPKIRTKMQKNQYLVAEVVFTIVRQRADGVADAARDIHWRGPRLAKAQA